MKITSGALLFSTGLLHEVLGVVACRRELASIWRDRVFDTVGPENPMRMAVCWFLVAGLAFMMLGAVLHYVETTVRRPLPRSMGFWLLLLGLSVVIPMPRSGGWLILPQVWLVFARAGNYRPKEVIAALGPVLVGADHIDVKTTDTSASLRDFTACMLSYQPGWLTALYRVRGGLVRLLGMRQEGVPRAPAFSAATLPAQPGEKAGIFTVQLAAENVWAAQADDRHLRATLAVVAAPVEQGVRPVHVITVVHYKHWTGPLYFNVIRPFHHLVVSAMMRAATRSAP